MVRRGAEGAGEREPRAGRGRDANDFGKEEMGGKKGMEWVSHQGEEEINQETDKEYI